MILKELFPDFITIAAVPDLTKNWRSELPVNENKTVYAYDAPLIIILRDYLDFKFDLIHPGPDRYGAELPDGNWTGVIGMVQHGPADVSISTLSINLARSKVVDFTVPYHYTFENFLTDKPEFLANRYTIVYPFTVSVWIATLVAILVVLMLFYMLERNTHDFKYVLLKVYGIFLEKSISFNFQKYSTKLLIFSWVIGAMFLTYSYKAVLLSFITFPTAVGIKDITQLSKAAESPKFRCSTYPGAYLYGALLNSTDESSRKIGECLHRNHPFGLDVEAFIRPKTYKKAFIGTDSHLQTFHKSFFVSPDSFFISMYGIAVKKTFCCRSVLDDAINALAASGLLLKLDRDLIFYAALEVEVENEESNPSRSLSLDDVSGAFIFHIAGCVLGLIIFAVELVKSRKEKSQKFKSSLLVKIMQN